LRAAWGSTQALPSTANDDRTRRRRRSGPRRTRRTNRGGAGDGAGCRPNDDRSVALTGNGSRLAGLADALERAVAMPVRPALLPEHFSSALPPDVVRAASPDWVLACGLALWDAAA